jgi:hypothetical protein
MRLSAFNAACELGLKYALSHSQSGTAPLAPNDFEPETRVIADIDTGSASLSLPKMTPDFGRRSQALGPHWASSGGGWWCGAGLSFQH